MAISSARRASFSYPGWEVRTKPRRVFGLRSGEGRQDQLKRGGQQEDQGIAIARERSLWRRISARAVFTSSANR
jgi:hypothetical protein